MEQDIIALVSIARKQQDSVQRGLQELDQQRRELEKTTSLLQRTAAGTASDLQRAVYSALQAGMDGAGERAAEVLVEAARPAVNRLNSFTSVASEAERRLQNASKSLSRRWLAVGVSMAMALVGSATLIANVIVEQKLAYLEELQQTASQWEERGFRARIVTCGPQARKCVRIDRTAGFYGDKSDYMVLAGY